VGEANMLGRTTLIFCLMWGMFNQLQAQQPSTAESLSERRAHADRTRWLFRDWAYQPRLARLRATPQDTRPISEYVRGFVTKDQFDELSEAFDRRLKTHLELSEKMNPYDFLERRSLMISQGRPEKVVNHAFPIPKGYIAPTADECRGVLSAYIRDQDKAENEWAAVVDEVLTPEQFGKFIRYFVYNGKSYLHHPLLRRYLGYSDAQQREIRKQLDLYESGIKKVRLRGGDSVNDLGVQRAYYRAYQVLTTTQFKSLAPVVGMKQEGESWSDMRARIKKAGGAVEEILGPMVDNVIQSFDK
jgi:hypothetical protein